MPSIAATATARLSALESALTASVLFAALFPIDGSVATS